MGAGRRDGGMAGRAVWCVGVERAGRFSKVAGRRGGGAVGQWCGGAVVRRGDGWAELRGEQAGRSGAN